MTILYSTGIQDRDLGHALAPDLEAGTEDALVLEAVPIQMTAASLVLGRILATDGLTPVLAPGGPDHVRT